MKQKLIAILLVVCQLCMLTACLLPQTAAAKASSFIDMNGHWAQSTAEWGLKRGLFIGIGENRFAPDMELSRAQIAQLLYRFLQRTEYAVAEKSTYPETYTDFDRSRWYAEAYAWALDKNMISAAGSVCQPDLPMQRQTVAAVIYTFAKYCGFATDERANLSIFQDRGEIDPAYTEAVTWACGAGLMIGTGDENFTPAMTVTRAQAVTLLYRFSVYFEQKTAANRKNYLPSTDNVKIGGRYYTTDDGITVLSTSSAYIEFVAAHSTMCTVTLAGDGTVTANEPEQFARIQITLDGTVVNDFMLSDNEKTITIFKDELCNDHIVKIQKVSEAMCSVAGIKSIRTNASSIYPTQNKEHFIEYYGDSYTAGYGIEGTRFDHFTTEQESSNLTYAYKLAYNFDADYSLVAYSGYGVLSGSGSAGSINTDGRISNVYDKVGRPRYPFHGTSAGDYEWDFQADRSADAVVIHLGENDIGYIAGDAARLTEFKDAYIELIRHIRENRPDAYIFCIVGFDGDYTYASMQQAVNEYTAATGDARVCSFLTTPIVKEYPVGAEKHPKEYGNKVVAAELTDLIIEKLGWDPVNLAAINPPPAAPEVTQ